MASLYHEEGHVQKVTRPTVQRALVLLRQGERLGPEAGKVYPQRQKDPVLLVVPEVKAPRLLAKRRKGL